MKATRRLAKTADGRLVPDTDPDAAFLAYTPGMQIPDDVARANGLLEPEQSTKKHSKPADKSAGSASNKGNSGE